MVASILIFLAHFDALWSIDGLYCVVFGDLHGFCYRGTMRDRDISCLGLGTQLSRATAFRRNEYVAELADAIIFASMHPGSSLYAIYDKYRGRKPVDVLG